MYNIFQISRYYSVRPKLQRLLCVCRIYVFSAKRTITNEDRIEVRQYNTQKESEKYMKILRLKFWSEGITW